MGETIIHQSLTIFSIYYILATSYYLLYTNFMLKQSRSKQVKQKLTLFAGLFFLVLSITGILFSVAQLQVVKEFLSRASGEPANLKVDTTGIVGPMPRPWRNLAQGGEDHAWRIQPIQNQINALHPNYIRIDHIYDFYDIVKGSPGNITFDFSKFDLILDDIKAAGATPYIALSYMPPAISSGGIVDKPVNWSDWQLVIEKTIEHVSGARNTPNVIYEVWNEPDLFGDWKYYGDKNYLTLYDYAARGATNARVNQSYKFGGPAITALYKNWFDAIIKHAIDNNIRLDFFSWHRYTTDIDQYRKDMIEVRNWITSYPQKEQMLEFHITEWGHDSNNHAGYDSNYSAAHSVAGAIEMAGVIDNAFVFEIQDGKDPAGQTSWGRWGMIQHNDFGAKIKPRYQALKMLDRIGNLRLQVLGKGSWVKALAGKNEAGNTTVVIANYDRYSKNAENVPLAFEHVESGNYTITKQFLNGQQQTENVTPVEGTINTTVMMTANSVAYVELKKVN